MEKKKLTMETWVWVIVQNPGNNESFLGQEDKENRLRFIPSFYNKDASLMCINLFQKDETMKYESQAVIYEDLVNYTKNNSYLIFFLDEKGKILDQIDPNTL